MIIRNHPKHLNAMVRLELCLKPHILFGIAPKSMQKGLGTTMLRYSDVHLRLTLTIVCSNKLPCFSASISRNCG